ncbi:TPA: hypothetical protein ACWLUJ_005737 [Pseudomonas aeruginosa]|nr:hypothetical protein [Pseudomonas aeruginosa]
MEFWKFFIIWMAYLVLAGFAGIWVLNTLFGLELPYEFKTWAAVTLGLFLISPAGTLSVMSKR